MTIAVPADSTRSLLELPASPAAAMRDPLSFLLTMQAFTATYCDAHGSRHKRRGDPLAILSDTAGGHRHPQRVVMAGRVESG